jgi:hypothetical protein
MGRLQPETSAEFHLLRCLREGRMCNYADVVIDDDKRVRAKFLRDVVVARLSDVSVAPTAIALNNAIIDGDLDCAGFGSAADPLPPLDLAGSIIDGTLNLTDSCWTSVRLDDCTLSGLTASRLRSDGAISAQRLAFDVGEPAALELDVEPTLTVDLEGLIAGSNVLLNELGRRSSARSAGFGACWLLLGQCRVGGSLVLSGSLLRNADGYALAMQGADIAGSVLLEPSGRYRFETMGLVQMFGARVAGNLEASGSGLRGRNGIALSLDNASIGGRAVFQSFERMRFEAKGGIWMSNADIGGQLNLIGACLDGPAEYALQMNGAKIHAAMLFRSDENFRFESVGTLSLREARIATLDGAGASCDAGAGHIALYMDGAEISGNVILRFQDKWRFESSGTVSVLDAKIAGVLDVSGGLLDGKGQEALLLDRAEINGGLKLSAADKQRFEARGTVQLARARIGSDVNCAGGWLITKGGYALWASGAEIRGNVDLGIANRRRFGARGLIDFTGAQIGGAFDASGACIVNVGGNALVLDSATVTGSVSLCASGRRHFRANGTLSLMGARIGALLQCSGARLTNTNTNPGRGAIVGDRATIAGSVFLNNTSQCRFTAVGGVRFLGASLGGQFNCLGAHFINATDDALTLELASVARSVFLRSSASARFSAKGRVNLSGARIGSQLECDGARFLNRGGVSLCAAGAQIGASAFLRGGGRHPFESCGAIDMRGCEIDGNLELGRTDPQTLRERIVSPQTLLDLTGATVRRTLQVRLGARSAGVIVLRGARVGELDDDGGAGWGTPARYRPARRQSTSNNSIAGILLRLDGFVYERLGSVLSASQAGAAADARSIWQLRKRWLEQQYIQTRPTAQDFFPQPHEHLVKTLQLMGHDRDARHIANHKSKHESRCGVNNRWQKFYKWVYRGLFGSGYLPERGVLTVFVWLLIGTAMVYGALWSNKLGDVVFVRSANSVEVVRSLMEPDRLAQSPTFDPDRDTRSKGTVSFGAVGKVQSRDVPCTGIYPPLYALDMMLPFVGLHIADKCEMADDAPVWAYTKAIYEMAGWLIVALAALTWTGVLRRDPG